MANVAFVFPGQGSQAVGMMAEWGDFQPVVRSIFDQAAEVLGYDLWKIVAKGPETELNRTEVTQPAMLCAGVASWQVIQQLADLPQPQLMAGHSLGEYSALVCAQSIDFTSAVDLVATRGALMQTAVVAGEGAMAAIIGLDDETVIQACAKVACGVVEAVNFNAPGQVVIAGHKASVEKAMENARGVGAKRALLLPVSVPSHCSLMQAAAEQLAEKLSKVEIAMPAIPVLHNQNVAIARSTDKIRELLKKQLYQPVKWADGIRYMQQQGIDKVIECGPGKVLSGLVRRIEKSMVGQAVFDFASLRKSAELFSQ